MKITEIENNIKNFESHMTVYFNKKSGKIIACPSGISDMKPYEEQDPTLLEIWDYEILPIDYNVIYNREDFMMKEGKIVVKNTTPIGKYSYTSKE
ncbi:hypothetical protein N2W52_002124 [Clostridium perfringens]|nr:hypothetical protein [Clostridium perfringens]